MEISGFQFPALTSEDAEVQRAAPCPGVPEIISRVRARTRRSWREGGNKGDWGISPNCYGFGFSIRVFKETGLDHKWHMLGTVAAPPLPGLMPDMTNHLQQLRYRVIIVRRFILEPNKLQKWPKNPATMLLYASPTSQSDQSGHVRKTFSLSGSDDLARLCQLRDARM